MPASYVQTRKLKESTALRSTLLLRILRLALRFSLRIFRVLVLLAASEPNSGSQASSKTAETFSDTAYSRTQA